MEYDRNKIEIELLVKYKKSYKKLNWEIKMAVYILFELIIV